MKMTVEEIAVAEAYADLAKAEQDGDPRAIKDAELALDEAERLLRMSGTL